MASIPPNSGNMDDCKKKPRCKWGENEGQSLPSDPNDYCPSGFTFRFDYCDCEANNGYYAYGFYEVNFDFNGQGVRFATPAHYIDVEQGGFPLVTGKAVYACQVESTLDSDGIKFFSGDAGADYQSGADCFLSGICRSSTPIWPLNSFEFYQTGQSTSGPFYTPFVNGISCGNYGPGRKDVNVKLLYGETLPEVEAARQAWLNGS